MTSVESVEEALRAWPCQVQSVSPLDGGANSATWLVVTERGRQVAKLVDDLDAPGLISGLRVAEFLASRGLRAGAPLRTRNGGLTVSLPEGELALVRHESGSSPDVPAPAQVRRAGRALARAHEALRDYPVESDRRLTWPWEWVDRLLDTIAVPEPVNEAARRLWPEVVRVVADHRLAVSVIHADPGLSCFLLADDAGGIGYAEENPADAIIDWVTTLRGPLLYDLACVVVMTKRSGPQVAQWFIEGYVAHMPQIRPQLAHLNWLVKARWLANAIYFSSRIERGIERGSESSTHNRDGLAEAYEGMTAGR